MKGEHDQRKENSGMGKVRSALLFLLAVLCGQATAALPERIDVIPKACEHLTETVASATLRGDVRPFVTNEHIPEFYSQCEYAAPDEKPRALRFVFKFMVKEMFDVDRLAPEQVDFNAGFAEGGLTHAERLQFPGELTYVFHERDITSILMLTGIDGPRNSALGDSTLIASFRLIDASRTPEQRRDVLMKFPWKLLGALNNSS
jgi:hypothetical protein